MNNKMICTTCLNEFVNHIWHPWGIYCSRKCRKKINNKKNNSFRWETASYEEQIQRMKDALEKDIIKTDGCWKWIGNKYPNGYGKVRCQPFGMRPSAHRASWIVYKGPIPDNMLVCHHCDNRLCVAPHHLFLGTTSDNLRDMHEKNRGMKGDNHCNAKLSVNKVKEIKKLLKEKVSHNNIAQIYKVSSSLITSINTGKVWKHVKDHND